MKDATFYVKFLKLHLTLTLEEGGFKKKLNKICFKLLTRKYRIFLVKTSNFEVTFLSTTYMLV